MEKIFNSQEEYEEARLKEAISSGKIILPEGPKGEPGEDYILTEQDKKDIASLIEVPVVEKVIDRVEVIKEIPIVTNLIEEVAITETPEEIRNKLELLKGDERLDAKSIKGLETKVEKDVLDRAIEILDRRTQYLINKPSGTSSAVVNQVQAIGFSISSPTSSDVITPWQVPFALTITKITLTNKGGTSVTANFQVYPASGLAGSGTNILSSSLTSTTAGASSTSFNGSNNVIPVDGYVQYVASAVSGTPSELVVRINYIRN